MDIWSVPNEGSCPCQFNPIGVTSHLIEGLEAGKEYTHYMQLTSAYGKKGPVTSLVQSMFTDVITNSTYTSDTGIILNVNFESGLGAMIKIGLMGQLGSIQREYFYVFQLVFEFFQILNYIIFEWPLLKFLTPHSIFLIKF